MKLIVNGKKRDLNCRTAWEVRDAVGRPDDIVIVNGFQIDEDCELKNYTKIDDVFGRGSSSGTHLGTDVWPGLNNILFTACPDDRIQQVFEAIRDLRKSLSKEGIKAFAWQLDEIT